MRAFLVAHIHLFACFKEVSRLPLFTTFPSSNPSELRQLTDLHGHVCGQKKQKQKKNGRHFHLAGCGASFWGVWFVCSNLIGRDSSNYVLIMRQLDREKTPSPGASSHNLISLGCMLRCALMLQITAQFLFFSFLLFQLFDLIFNFHFHLNVCAWVYEECCRCLGAADCPEAGSGPGAKRLATTAETSVCRGEGETDRKEI